jgi:hypothetical protein
MSSLTPKDRVSLCMFSYADGRRCRTPRIASHPHFCYDHAQKESRAVTADKLANDLAAFFSGHYISANDLSTALARMIPAVVRGDIKPRTARTVAYMAQTLLQSIHHAQSEFHDAFGPDNYRKSIRTGITSNHTRLFPPDPVPNAASASTLESVAAKSAAIPSPTHPVCHPERSEGSLPSAPAPTNAEPQPAPPHPPASPHPVCHPERSEGSLPVPAAAPNAESRPAASTQPSAPNNQPPANPKRRPDSPHRDPYAIHFDHTHRLLEPEKAY